MSGMTEELQNSIASDAIGELRRGYRAKSFPEFQGYPELAKLSEEQLLKWVAVKHQLYLESLNQVRGVPRAILVQIRNRLSNMLGQSDIPITEQHHFFGASVFEHSFKQNKLSPTSLLELFCREAGLPQVYAGGPSFDNFQTCIFAYGGFLPTKVEDAVGGGGLTPQADAGRIGMTLLVLLLVVLIAVFMAWFILKFPRLIMLSNPAVYSVVLIVVGSLWVFAIMSAIKTLVSRRQLMLQLRTAGKPIPTPSPEARLLQLFGATIFHVLTCAAYWAVTLFAVPRIAVPQPFALQSPLGITVGTAFIVGMGMTLKLYLSAYRSRMEVSRDKIN